MTEPTLTEVVRRFEEATQRLSVDVSGLTKEIREERRTNERTYLRQDVYAADRRADASEKREIRTDLDELKTARGKEQDWRRTISLALATCAASALVSGAIAVFQLVTRK